MTGSKTTAAQSYHRKPLTYFFAAPTNWRSYKLLCSSASRMHLEEPGTPSQDTGAEHCTHTSSPNPQAGPLPTSCHPRSRPVTARQARLLCPLPLRLGPRRVRGESKGSGGEGMPAPPGRKARVGAARGPQEFGIHHPPAKRAPPCRRSCGPSAGPGWACCRRPRPPRCWSRPAGVACRAESGAPWTAGPWRARPTWRGRLGARGRRSSCCCPPRRAPTAPGLRPRSAAALSEALRRPGWEPPLPPPPAASPRPALGCAGLRCSAPRAPAPRRSPPRVGSHLGPRRPASTATPPSRWRPRPRSAWAAPARGAGTGGGEGRRAAPPPPAAPQEVRREPSAAVLPASNLAFQEAGLVETARCPQSKCLTEIRGGKRRWRMLFHSTRDH